MLERTKTRTTEEFAEICFQVPVAKAAKVRETIENMLALAGIRCTIDARTDDDETVPLEEVFPDIHPGSAIRGLRFREELTQARLAEIMGVKRQHISEMENGKRPIGKAMAKRLAKALNTGYKVFL